ncbi:MAG TPA: hypothetical protein VMS09_17100 [Paenibacillus sp.]|uniref:hypothetical protein n=1 Tax=Paenibacillus sp. TaxID=58172 RepID=UPI002B9D3C6D|nr:hypothetical protein [Paenibacillus sp.]HUC93706.1 hypothetical protein [Paenibacillus sp.]
MSEQLNRIEDMLGQLIKIVGETNAKVDRLEWKVGETNAKVDRLEWKVTSIGTQIDEVVSNQERHERLLEVLSKRSLEQESHIDDFRRNK